MNRFYIDKLIVTGGNHEPSIIDFKPGLNFILGPSNTGKTLIMDCLDYMFGFSPKKDRPSKIVDNNNGYDKIILKLLTKNGTVILERLIGDSKINVSGSDSTVETGVYSVGHTAKKNINSLYLHLLGIEESHSVRSAEKGSKTQELTWRSMLHLFFLRQSDVARESSALLAPNSWGPTASASVLLFLLTGQDANSIQLEEDPKIGEARKKALMAYMKKKIDEYSKRRIELEEIATEYKSSNAVYSIDSLRKKILELKTKMESATKESNSIMSQIYECNSKLSESHTVEHNFDILYHQYQTDIKRIGFIIDGSANVPIARSKIICPICGEETENIQDSEVLSASSAELEKIKSHLSELQTTRQSLKKQQKKISDKIAVLEERKNEISRLVSEQIQPQLASLEQILEKQMKIVSISSEISVLQKSENEYRSELFVKATEKISKQTTHNVYEDFGYDVINGFEEELRALLKASKIGGASSAMLNMDTFDIEIDGKKKSVSMGGGFCGILNTITTLAMSAYLLKSNKFAPGFYAVDSSLTQLSESGYKEQKDTVKENFINHLMVHALDRQVIIVEQSDRMPFIPKESNEKGIHVISFTRDRHNGRYGFLNDVYNPDKV